jgi:hypothetical protein
LGEAKVTDTPGVVAPLTIEHAISARKQLETFVEGEVGNVILMIEQANRLLDFSRLTPTPRALPALNGVVRGAAKAYSNCELIGYAPAGLTAGRERMWIPVADVPMLKAIADSTVDPANIRLYSPSKSPLDELRLAAMRVQVAPTTAIFIQSLTDNQILAQSTRIGMMVKRGVIDLPPKGDILLFSRTVDAVIVGTIAFFKDRPAFQRIFGYLEAMKAQAATTFQSVTATLRIEGLDVMTGVVTDSPAMLGKMASIQRKIERYPQYREALTMPKLVAFIAAHPECGVDVKGEGDDAHLVFVNDAQHRFKILKLLDDDYLRSQLTELDYEANSKGAPVERKK